MTTQTHGPAIVLSDCTVLVEADQPGYDLAREALAPFAELEKSPEHIHTYRITPLSLWNAAAAGATSEEVLTALAGISRYELPEQVVHHVREQIARFGRIRLERDGGRLVLRSDDPALLAELCRTKALRPFILELTEAGAAVVDAAERGRAKVALVRLGYPPVDLAGYVDGARLPIALRAEARRGGPFALRAYQSRAVDAFLRPGDRHGGSGVVVLPCGAGKTLVGIGAMASLGMATLILTPNAASVQQWIAEIVDKTSLSADDVGEYTGERKQIRPVTITTYQMLTYRPSRRDRASGEPGDFPHFGLFQQNDWGLIVYDEVHLLPAPVFRVTAEIQARRRLGLTATLVREDGRETDVFSLIGPKRFELPWRALERDGYIAPARCVEVRLDLPRAERDRYESASERERVRIAAENPAKLAALERLLERHRNDRVLVIGQYLDQLAAVAELTGAPIITGRAPNRVRDSLYAQFRAGELSLLIVSKVANFAIDLPDANVAIQLSGTFGSRQEEAQRLGRVLRPKSDGGSALFYSLVTRDSRDQEFAAKRQRFLTEQGYHYRILDGVESLEQHST